jgi:Domain of unknown function (DUF4440)
MRKQILPVLVLVLAVSSAPISARATCTLPSLTLIEELKKAESDLSTALIRRDKLWVGHLLADESKIIEPDGSLHDKNGLIEEFNNKSLKFDVLSPQEVEVQVYGEIGVVSGKLTAEWERSGHENFGTFRFTDVFIRRNDHWQLVTRQLTDIKR